MTNHRNAFLRAVFAVTGSLSLWLAGSPFAAAQAPRPNYQNKLPVEKQDPADHWSFSSQPAIQLGKTPYFSPSPPAARVNPGPTDPEKDFSWRAGAAILYAAGLPIYPGSEYKVPKAGIGGEDFGTRLLAKMAYPDYFGSGDSYRTEVDTALSSEQPGKVGTNGDYDMLLTAYITLYYKYYDSLPQSRDHIFKDLLSLRGKYDSSERYSVTDPVTIPETENHRLMIQSAKYLTNQLYFQKAVADDPRNFSHDDFDNNRNGHSTNPVMTDVILTMLQRYLMTDFVEYNSRPYQDLTVSALLNLASYAYDDRVRVSARMVLDYISAKVAVSSQNLRRFAPFRRRNEHQHYGPVDLETGFLSSPLVYNRCCVPVSINSDQPAYEPDPQGAFYAMLSGDTSVLGDNAPGNYAFEMIRAALSDYRVPPTILDLFVSPGSRRFYQAFNHYAGFNDGWIPGSDKPVTWYVHEVYAGSPSYLISAGGNPSSYAYGTGTVDDYVYSAAGTLGFLLGGTVGISIAAAAEKEAEAYVRSTKQAALMADIGVAAPTTFIPDWNAPHPADPGKSACSYPGATPGTTGFGVCLGDIIQLGKVSVAHETEHLCVDLDFACGGPLYLPPGFDPIKNPRDPDVVQEGNWTFVNRGSALGKPGYFLAIFRFFESFTNQVVNDWAFLEAYDTSICHTFPGTTACIVPFSFDDFKARVKTANPATQFSILGVNTYLTQSGQQILFVLAPQSRIVRVPFTPTNFAIGDIVNSNIDSSQGVGSGVITISNPTLGTQITLDMHAAAANGDALYGLHHPSRTSESGEVERAGNNWEVWVDFAYPGSGTAGDSSDPYKTLAQGVARVAEGGTIKIVHLGPHSGAFGCSNDNKGICIGKKMTLQAVSDPVKDPLSIVP